MDHQGNGGTVENFRDFAASRGRRQPRHPSPLEQRLIKAEAIHRGAHQSSGRAPARKGYGMKQALVSLLLWVWWALLLGAWLRLVWFFFHMWGPV